MEHDKDWKCGDGELVWVYWIYSTWLGSRRAKKQVTAKHRESDEQVKADWLNIQPNRTLRHQQIAMNVPVLNYHDFMSDKHRNKMLHNTFPLTEPQIFSIYRRAYMKIWKNYTCFFSMFQGQHMRAPSCSLVGSYASFPPPPPRSSKNGHWLEKIRDF